MWIVVAIALVLPPKSTLAHSWYPPECCSDRDCWPIRSEEVARVPGGYLLDGEFIPEERAKEGKDDRYHVCRFPFPKVICFFKPYNGS